MRKIALSLAVLSAILLPALYAAPAHAQFFHTWVSHSGSDANNCTSASPCATFTRALALTTQGAGEVSCLDSGSFGRVTITFSVTIDCGATVAVTVSDTVAPCVDGISINAPGGVVTLRGLNVTGFNYDPSCAFASGIFIRTHLLSTSKTA
jgi:hypothetical protein